MEVHDARPTPFRGQPARAERPDIGFYAHAPADGGGHALCTLSWCDHVPRTPLPGAALRAARPGREATAQIELRRTVADLQRAVDDR